MKSKSDFRSSKSEAENRIVNVAKTFELNVKVDHSVCLNCGAMKELRRGELGQLFPPSSCNQCKLVYSRKYQFCIPDMILSGSGIVFVNEDEAHGKNPVVEKDKTQIELLRSLGWKIFVITDHEIFGMTNSSIRLWLLGVIHALQSVNLPEAVYHGEKEYRCLNE